MPKHCVFGCNGTMINSKESIINQKMLAIIISADINTVSCNHYVIVQYYHYSTSKSPSVCYYSCISCVNS